MKDLVSRCPIEEVMQVLGGRWPTLLIYYLKDGTKRFSDLRRDNPTVSHRILTLELRKLERPASSRGRCSTVIRCGSSTISRRRGLPWCR